MGEKPSDEFHPYSKDPISDTITKVLALKRELDVLSPGGRKKGKASSELDIEGAQMLKDDADEPEVVMKKNTGSILLLTGAKVDLEGTVRIITAIQGNSWLTTVDLSWNPSMKDDGAIALANALKGNTTLKSLYLTECGIGSTGAIALCDEKVALGLVKLDLSQNSIGNSAGDAIGAMIKANRPLVTLCLGQNKFTSDGVKPIAEGLVTNTKLNFLQLNYMQIGNKGAKAFKAALEVNCSLIKLLLGGILCPNSLFPLVFDWNINSSGKKVKKSQGIMILALNHMV